MKDKAGSIDDGMGASVLETLRKRKTLFEEVVGEIEKEQHDALLTKMVLMWKADDPRRKQVSLVVDKQFTAPEAIPEEERPAFWKRKAELVVEAFRTPAAHR
jgi:hypothetical protein